MSQQEMPSNEDIKVACRVRPLIQNEDLSFVEISNDQKSVHLKSDTKANFSFDHVFSEDEDQFTVYEVAAKGTIQG